MKHSNLENTFPTAPTCRMMEAVPDHAVTNQPTISRLSAFATSAKTSRPSRLKIFKLFFGHRARLAFLCVAASLLALVLPLATSLNDFLAHAAERPIGADEGAGTDEQTDNPGNIKKDEKFFPSYSAKVLQKRLPMAMLIETAQSGLLPKNLRRDLARSTWTRAVLVNDLPAAMKLQPILQELDPALWKSMEAFRSAADDHARRFVGILIILQNPGLKPSAREGYLRDATLGDIDNYRDNWWCNSMNGGANWSDTYDADADPAARPDPDAKIPFPAWLTESQKSAALSEWKRLLALGTAPNYLAHQVLERATQDSQDPSIPQALHLAVRATRYGCSNKETSALSKAAFDYLHFHYPDNEWTTKTKYYY